VGEDDNVGLHHCEQLGSVVYVFHYHATARIRTVGPSQVIYTGPVFGTNNDALTRHAQGTMCKMIAQCTQQGKSIDEAITFGERELEGYMRT